jgi:hypothetical protein
VSACGSDGSAWQLDTQNGLLTHYTLEGGIDTVPVPEYVQNVDTVTPIGGGDGAQGDYVWLTGNTNRVVLYDPTGQFHPYSIELAGSSSITPVPDQGGQNGNLEFRIPGNAHIDVITTAGVVNPVPAN